MDIFPIGSHWRIVVFRLKGNWRETVWEYFDKIYNLAITDAENPLILYNERMTVNLAKFASSLGQQN